ncbi:hypothetical protein FDECE_492 [Fusarium decemcellulare]|nr:hypothetical protein FDECE_492 [Fusarium decemcellulare]
MAPVSVLPPTFEQHHDGFGVQCPRPRISWRFTVSDEGIRNWRQIAYDIEISTDNRESVQVFRVKGPDSVLVPWPSPETLGSRARRHVRVRSHGLHSRTDRPIEVSADTGWSRPSLLEIALLDNSEWTGRMITTLDPWPLSSDGSARPLCFHKSFDLPLNPSAINKARLYITSHGVYSAQINGKKVGNHCLSPGFQSFHKRLHYQIYDAKNLLKTSGSNNIEVEVAAGWFASAWTWAKKRFIYGQKLGILAQLEVWSEDSTTPLVVSTDDSWKASTSALVSSEIYDGEIHDQRLNTNTRTDGSICFATQESPIPVSRLISPEAPPVRVVRMLEPRDIFKSRSGDAIIVDFGQNCAGRVCVRKINKPSGTSVTFRHAEVIQDGEIVVRPLRTAKATDVLICDGSDIIDWHPKHTYHGFRFVEITGWIPEDLGYSSIVAEVLHTDMQFTGVFRCSDGDLNRLHDNSEWGMKSNFLSVPTESPARDERLGWTGDLNLFMPTANFLFDTAGMLKNWLDDLYLDQMEESTYWRQGVVPLFAPNCLLRKDDDSHGWDPMPNGVWGDAAIMIPWELYRTSGDISFLSRQYDSMLQYMKHGVVRGEDGLWDPEQWQFGDWLDPRAPQNDSGRGTTDGTFVADCFLIESTRIVAEVAQLLDKPQDSSRFRDTHTHLLQSWQSKYLSATGFVVPDTATSLSLALSLDLIPDSADGRLRKQAASRLSRIVRLNDFKITTGFVGTAFLPFALARTGYVDLAYAMVFQKQCPSFLYPVTMGATTVWERWDSMLPDGSVNPGSMTSFNHHALGSIAHWLHTDVAGIDVIEPGWKVFRVRPRPNKDLDRAGASFESKYGLVDVRWTLVAESFRLTVRVPPNSAAVITMPEERGEERRVGSGYYIFVCRFIQTDWPPKALLPPWGRAEF